jgi:hypothetical protein
MGEEVFKVTFIRSGRIYAHSLGQASGHLGGEIGGELTPNAWLSTKRQRQN